MPKMGTICEACFFLNTIPKQFPIFIVNYQKKNLTTALMIKSYNEFNTERYICIEQFYMTGGIDSYCLYHPVFTKFL